MRKYLTELIGTFFLVFTIYCVVVTGSALAPLAIGAVLTAMVFAGGHVSGGHFNPAVTLAVFLRGKLPVRDLLPYASAQIIGGLVGAAVARLVVGLPQAPAMNVTGKTVLAAFVGELVITFALAYVVINVATSKDHPNNSFYGLAIGFTVMAGALAVGPVSGGAFNPAVAVAISAAGLASWSMIWLYLTASLIGGALAAVAFRVINPSDVVEAPLAPPVEALVRPVPTKV